VVHEFLDFGGAPTADDARDEPTPYDSSDSALRVTYRGLKPHFWRLFDDVGSCTQGFEGRKRPESSFTWVRHFLYSLDVRMCCDVHSDIAEGSRNGYRDDCSFR
jgi:hypothetical protein